MKAKLLRTKLKKGDPVVVIAGKEKGKQGKILDILRHQEKVLVEGINIVKKTIKKTQENPSGGITSREAPVHISNVMYYEADSGKGVRLGIKNDDKKRVRYSKASGATID
ncbi:MAG TPA: 50S ribosomal protein L24 [Spirochaetota bacterium]|nr:50S ribosomal protein L24 [Spirochaetota bacterium]